MLTYERVPEFQCDSCKRYVKDSELEDMMSGTFCFECLAEMSETEPTEGEE